MTIASIIVLVRLPPADLAGWLAATLHAPVGIPYLVAGTLFLGAASLLRGAVERWQRTLGRISVIGAAAMYVIGLLLINEHI